MHELSNFDFVIGIALGKILLGALLASPYFRNAVLAATAAIICIIYSQKGTAGLLQQANQTIADFSLHPNFTKGVALGAILAFVIFGAYLKREPV